MTRLQSNLEHNDMDAPNANIAGEPRLLDLLNPNKSDRPSLEDYLENDTSESVGPSITTRTSRVFVVFVFLFLVLAGGALSWRYYSDQATGSIRAWASGATSKPTVPPEGFVELQQQLKSLAVDLAAVRHTLEQQSAANHDQLTRIQEQIAQQNIALQATKQELSQKLSSSTPAAKPLPKPAQHSAHASTQDSSRPVHVASPQSLPPPKQ